MDDPVCAERVLCRALQLRATFGLSTSPAEFRLLRRAALAGMLILIENHQLAPVAYAVVARVAKEGMRQFLRAGDPPAYDYEWDEGQLCLVLDVLVLPRHRAAALATLRRLLGQQRCVAFVRNGAPELYLRWRGCWRRRPVRSDTVAAHGARRAA